MKLGEVSGPLDRVAIFTRLLNLMESNPMVMVFVSQSHLLWLEFNPKVASMGSQYVERRRSCRFGECFPKSPALAGI